MNTINFDDLAELCRGEYDWLRGFLGTRTGTDLRTEVGTGELGVLVLGSIIGGEPPVAVSGVEMSAFAGKGDGPDAVARLYRAVLDHNGIEEEMVDGVMVPCEPLDWKPDHARIRGFMLEYWELVGLSPAGRRAVLSAPIVKIELESGWSEYEENVEFEDLRIGLRGSYEIEGIFGYNSLWEMLAWDRISAFERLTLGRDLAGWVEYSAQEISENFWNPWDPRADGDWTPPYDQSYFVEAAQADMGASAARLFMSNLAVNLAAARATGMDPDLMRKIPGADGDFSVDAVTAHMDIRQIAGLAVGHMAKLGREAAVRVVGELP